METFFSGGEKEDVHKSFINAQDILCSDRGSESAVYRWWAYNLLEKEKVT